MRRKLRTWLALLCCALAGLIPAAGAEDVPLDTGARQQELAGAITAAEQTVSESERQYGGTHPTTAEALNDLANLYRLNGWDEKAAALYERALDITSRSGPDSPQAAMALHNYAHLETSRGRYGQAEQLYRRALAIWEHTFGLQDTHVGVTLNNLAEVSRLQQRFEEAETLQQRALEIFEAAYPPEHPAIAAARRNLSSAHTPAGQVDTRTLTFLTADQAPSVLGAPSSAASVAKHTDVLLATASTTGAPSASAQSSPQAARPAPRSSPVVSAQADAEAIERWKLSSMEQALGREHPNLVPLLLRLAELADQRDAPDEAEAIYQRALAIDEQELPESADRMAGTLKRFGEFYEGRQRFGEARVFYQRVSDLLTPRRGANHTEVLWALERVAACLEAEGRLKDAQAIRADLQKKHKQKR